MRTLVLAALVLAPSAAAVGAGTIQPGDLLNGVCVLGFAFDAADGSVLFATAAHCVRYVGEPVRTPGFEPFGTVAWIEERDGSGYYLDAALVKVEPAYAPFVSNEVLGRPGTPTGLAEASETAVGDRILATGHNAGLTLVHQATAWREGALTHDDGKAWRGVAPLVPGDSGGPVLHASGEALGLVSRLQLSTLSKPAPPGGVGAWDEGPTVRGILDAAASDGWVLALRTA